MQIIARLQEDGGIPYDMDVTYLDIPAEKIKDYINENWEQTYCYFVTIEHD